MKKMPGKNVLQTEGDSRKVRTLMRDYRRKLDRALKSQEAYDTEIDNQHKEKHAMHLESEKLDRRRFELTRVQSVKRAVQLGEEDTLRLEEREFISRSFWLLSKRLKKI